MQPTYERHSKTKLVSTMVTIIVIAGIVMLADHLKAKSVTNVATTTSSMTTVQPVTKATTTPATTNSDANATTTSTSAYKDGTYSASSDYYVPHGDESIQVSLTIKDGVVIGSSITNSEGDHDSAVYQADFMSVYKSYVIGKNISGLKLSAIAGASDTTQGFNDALSKIATKAQA